MSALRGSGVSPGIAVGPALVMERDAAPVFRLAVPAERVEAEAVPDDELAADHDGLRARTSLAT